MHITVKEKKWIKDFQKLAKNIPPSLWLFATSNKIHVMQLDWKEERGIKSDGLRAGETIDPSFSIAEINIPAEGGSF